MTVEQLLKVILNDQAFLYALIQESRATLVGDSVITPEQFEAWQDEWMELTKEILEGLDNGDND